MTEWYGTTVLPILPVRDTRHFVSAAAVVQDGDGRVLLIRRADNGAWEIPGGGVEPAEDLHSALVREVAEETGLRVRPGRLTGVYKHMTQNIIALVFYCTLDGGTATTSPESTAVEFVEPDRLVELVTERIRIRIEDALVQYPEAIIRAHSYPGKSSQHGAARNAH